MIFGGQVKVSRAPAPLALAMPTWDFIVVHEQALRRIYYGGEHEFDR
jgi:hypothetical protein